MLKKKVQHTKMFPAKDKDIFQNHPFMNKTKNVHGFTLIYIDFSLYKCECKLCLEERISKRSIQFKTFFIGTVVLW